MVIPRPDAPVATPAPVVFFGSPIFAVPTLRALADAPEFAVRLVVTQPPRGVGRGKVMQRSAVHDAAEALGLPILTPERLRGDAVLDALRAMKAALFVVAAYGKILRPDVLAIPARGTLNVHASLLPAYRGASPVHAAILDGVAVTGVTIMLMDAGLDTGPVLAQEPVAVTAMDTSASLTDRLADVGGPLLVETAVKWLAGALVPTPQDDGSATFTRLIRKEDGDVDWSLPAERIARMERAYTPWPGVYSWLAGERLILHDLRPVPATGGDRGQGTGERGKDPDSPLPLVSGTIVAVTKDGIRVATGAGEIVIAHVQPEGKRVMDAPSFAAGRRALVGMRFAHAAPALTPDRTQEGRSR